MLEGNAFIGQWASNITRIWHDKLKADMTISSPRARLTEGATLLQHPPPARDWHGGPFPTHGELAQGLTLTMRPTRTASPLCFFSPQWPETRLLPGSCANILAHFVFEVCFQKFSWIYIITKIAQFTGQEKLQRKSSKLNVILSDLTFVIDRVARKPNRSL